MDVNSTVRLLLVVLVEFLLYCHGGRPLKVYAKGYNGRNLPPDGGWTSWFNSDFPSVAGDYETLYQIRNTFGRGCKGVPCKKPIAIKVQSVNGLSPEEEGNMVTASPRKGMHCANSNQHHGTCADYRVRFYCPNMAIECRHKSKTSKEAKYAKFLKYQKERNRTIRKSSSEYDASYRQYLLNILPPLKHRWTNEEIKSRPTKQLRLTVKQPGNEDNGNSGLKMHSWIHDI